MLTSFEVKATPDGGAVSMTLNLYFAGGGPDGTGQALKQAVVMTNDMAARLGAELATVAAPKDK